MDTLTPRERAILEEVLPTGKEIPGGMAFPNAHTSEEVRAIWKHIKELASDPGFYDTLCSFDDEPDDRIHPTEAGMRALWDATPAEERAAYIAHVEARRAEGWTVLTPWNV